MCRKKPGLRCAYDTSKCMTKAQEALDANKLASEQTEAALRTVETESELKALTAKLAQLEKRGQEIEASLESAQREYDMTDTGQAELQEQILNESLSEEEREALETRKNQALEAAAARKEQNSRQVLKRENIKHYLEGAGVDAERIADIVAIANNDKGNPHPRSAKDYTTALKNARKKRMAVEEKVVAAEADVRKQATAERWDQKTTDEAIAAVNVQFAKERQDALEAVKKARFNYDSTAKGQEELKALIAKTPSHEFEKRAKYKVRLSTVVKSHADGMSDRKTRELLKKKVTEAMKSVGKNPKPALNALLAKERLANEPRLAPHEVRTTLKSTLTEKESAQLMGDFRNSQDYKKGGDAAFNSWVERRIMASPLTRHTAGSVEAANAEAEMGFDNRPHRHFSSAAGGRNVHTHFSLTKWQVRKLKGTADTLEMSVASYVRAMATGSIDPFAIQNDRSSAHNKKKAEASKKAIAEWRQAA